MPRKRNSQCVCGHHRSMHSYITTGLGRLGPCLAWGPCSCSVFTPPAQVRAERREAAFASALARARREHSEAEARTSSQEGKDE